MSVVLSSGREFCALAREMLGQDLMVRYRAAGSSMYPLLRHGDVLQIWPVEVDEVQIGDVILSESVSGSLLAHRLVHKINEGQRVALVTRGDALSYEDTPRGSHDLLGRVECVERDHHLVDQRVLANRLLGQVVARYPFLTSRLVPWLACVKRALPECLQWIPGKRTMD